MKQNHQQHPMRSKRKETVTKIHFGDLVVWICDIQEIPNGSFMNNLPKEEENEEKNLIKEQGSAVE